MTFAEKEEMTVMKKLVVSVLMITLVTLSGSALAQGKVWDDLSWWGQSGATPAPVKDATRSGYWWWPREPVSNAGDAEAWGNRGVVYSMYTEPVAKKPPVVTPPVAPPPAPARQFVVLNNVLFDFDKSVLKPEGKAEVDKLVAELKKYPKDTVAVVGHTCNVGPDAYNMGLGQRRADAVAKHLVASGIDASRITASSKGETEPAVPNDTPANRKLNRRAQFLGQVVN